jgi:antitoxin CptB
MPDPEQLRRLKFRAWHRGTREMDYIVGCYFDRYHSSWGQPEIDWFEALLNEEDPDVMAWAMGTQAVPERLAGTQMEAFQRLDFVNTAR